MNQSRSAGVAVRGGLTLTLLAALLYSLTLSRHYTADSLLYALTIDGANLQSLIDPTHLLLHPLALLWFRTWQAVGWTGRSLLPLQMLNALAGAFCVTLLWSLARTVSRSTLAAAIIGLGFAFSGGLWLLSVEAEFVTIPLAMQLLTLWCILGALQKHAGRSWYAVFMGLLVAIAIFAYLTSAFLILVVLVGFLLTDLAQNVKYRQIALFVASILLIVIPVYVISLQIWTEGDFGQLALLSEQGSYGQLNWANIPHGIYAFLRSLGLFPGLVMNDSTRDLLAVADNKTQLLFFAYYCLVATFMLLPVMCLKRHWQTLWPTTKRSLLVLSTWSITFAVFAFYWVPGDITFWMPLLAAWWLLVAICSSSIYDMRWLSGILLAILLLGTTNATQVILPRTILESNQAYKTARYIANNTEDKDTILMVSDDITLLTVIYFSAREVLPVQTPIYAREDLPSWLVDEIEIGNINVDRILMLKADQTLREVR